ncbi:MAG: hypothetical protein F6K56_40750 [Moorea sp. SIO3G5]|nr:hypothetical protein [Moorena sp. SIO3G5]
MQSRFGLNPLFPYCIPFAFCLLPFASCLLPFAFCLLPLASCLLPFASCLLPLALARSAITASTHDCSEYSYFTRFTSN